MQLAGRVRQHRAGVILAFWETRIVFDRFIGVDRLPVGLGGLFDFGFGALGPGETKRFTVYYGAAPSETDAIAALNAGGAQVYSLGESSCDGDTVDTCTGTGAAAAFGRLASIIAPFLVPVLVVAGGQVLAFVVFALAFAIASAAAFTLPEQRGKALAE